VRVQRGVAGTGLLAVHPGIGEYPSRTTRVIPVIVLEPIDRNLVVTTSPGVAPARR